MFGICENLSLSIKMENGTGLTSTSSTTKGSETVIRPLGFLPLYSSNSTIPETNNSSQNTTTNAKSGINNKSVPAYLMTPPPPYPLDVPPKPYPLDTNSETPLENAENKSLINPATSEIDNNNKGGLTSSEKEVVTNLFLRMQNTALGISQVERKEYSDAENKLIELLREAQPRLTKSEKEEFLKEVRQVNQLKKNRGLERQKEERRVCGFEQYSETEYAVDFWAVVLKIPELAMTLIAFQKNITRQCSHYGILFNVICLSAALCTACLLIFYCTCRKSSMFMLICEFLYCCTCFVAFLVFSLYFICGDVLFFGFAATIAYGSEMLTKIHAMYRRQKSLDTTQRRVLRFQKYRKWQYWFPKDRTSSIENGPRGQRHRAKYNRTHRVDHSRSNSSGSESDISLNFLNNKSSNEISGHQNKSRKNSDRSENSANSNNED